MEEKELIRLFTDLTGESERTAQSVIMYLDILADRTGGAFEEAPDQATRASTPSADQPSEGEAMSSRR